MRTRRAFIALLILLGLSGLPETDITPFSSPKAALAEARELAPSLNIQDLVVLRDVSNGSSFELLKVPLDGRTIAEAISEEHSVPGTRAVTLNRLVHRKLVPSDNRFVDQEHLEVPTQTNYGVDAVGAWNTTTGSSEVVVAVVDTGVRPHAEFGSRLLPGYDFFDNDFDAFDPGAGQCLPYVSASWHGTHVAGIVAAGLNAFGVVGVAPGVRVLPIRSLGCVGSEDGAGRIVDILNGVRWAAGVPIAGYPDNPNPADIINMSLGVLGMSCDLLSRLIFEEVAERGVLVVAAAGNESTLASESWPANCRNVMSVGASRPDGNRAWFSNFGSDVDVYAPGNSILSTVDLGARNPTSDGYARYQGTSMAAPIVSGIAALVLSVNPTLTPGQVAQILRQSATDCRGGTCPQNIVNARRAVSIAGGTPPASGEIDSEATPPTLSAPPTPDPTIEQERYGGADQFSVAEATARHFAARRAMGGVTEDLHVTLANGNSYPDGLAASVIAGYRDGVILFTNKDELPLATDRFLSEFDVQRVTIIGGTAVVSDALAQSLMSRGIVIDRLAGATRYETADAVASAALIEDGQYVPLYKGKKYLFIASGQNFPDAVAAGSAAYVGSYPLILASSGGLSSASLEIVVAWHRSNPAGRVMILGGTAAVPALVETQLREHKRPWVEGTDGYFGGDFCDNYPYDWPHCPIDEIPEPITRVSRLAGADRFMTAWAIANWARDNVFTSTSGDVGFATGLEFSNALAAVPLLGQDLFQGPLLLTSRCTHLPSATRSAARGYSTQRVIGSDIDLCDYDAKVLAGGS